MKRRSANFKVLIISIVMGLLFVVVGANVFIVSIFGYHINSQTDVKEIIEGIHTVNETVIGNRGDIVDTKNNIIATNRKAYTLFAIIDENRVNSGKEAAYVEDKEATAEIISDVINEDYEFVLKTLQRDDVSQVEFGLKGKKINSEQKKEIESYNLPGVGFMPILARHYPNKHFASSLLGISLYDEQEGNLTGRFGIELNYEEYLEGKNGKRIYQQDKDGYILPQVKIIEEEAKDGAKVKLTLESTIQEALEIALERISNDEEVQATEAWAGIMEVKTGKVVGWADYPSFDPNILDIKSYENKGTQFTYEPGSTMKTFTVGAAIEEGVWNGDETFDSSAFYVGNHNDKPVRLPTSNGSIATITNAMNIDYGQMTYDRGFDMSSNVMIAELLSKKLEPEIFHDYLHRLGFFQAVDTDQVPENIGVDLWNHPLEKITNGFGQGSTVTMLQLLQAYSATLSDGTMVKPYFVEGIIDEAHDEILYEGKTKIAGKPFKESTALRLRDMMRTVVSKGSAQRYDIEEIEVVGKTGTAQKVVDGVYSPTDYIFSSALAFPYNDPEYVVYYAYEARYGHNINASAEHVNDLVRKIVSNYGLKDEYNDKIVESTKLDHLKNYINLSATSAEKQLESLGYKTLVIGDGETIKAQYPKPNNEVLSNERIMLYTNSGNIEMPDMENWSYKEVIAFWKLTGIEVEITGSGFVTEQSIPKETILDKDDVIQVKMK